MSSTDIKSSRVFVKQVTTHLQKFLRSDDGKDNDALLEELEMCITMIKFSSATAKQAAKKKPKKKLKKPSSVDGESQDSPPVAGSI